MYAWTLFLHSTLRWLALLALVGSFGRSASGWLTGRPADQTDRRLGLVATILVDVQLLVGLALYLALSPITHAAFQDFGGAMKDPVQRFWAVEHIAGMAIAWVLIHVAAVLAKKASSDAGRLRALAVGNGLALLLILASIPWPFRGAVGRPWFTVPF